jgi:hypothetical protein
MTQVITTFGTPNQPVVSRAAEARSVAKPDFFFLPGQPSPSFKAQRVAAQRACAKILKDNLVAVAQGAPVESEPRGAPLVDMFGAAVPARTRLMAVAMPFVLAHIGASLKTSRRSLTWAVEQARDQLWKSLRSVCRAFNTTILQAEPMLWMACFSALPTEIREHRQVAFAGSGRRAWFVAMARVQRGVNRRPQEWQGEVLITYQTYWQCVARLRARGRSTETDRDSIEFLFDTVVQQLKARGLFVQNDDAQWDRLP